MGWIGSLAHNTKLHEDAECGWWMADDVLFEGLGNGGKDINMVWDSNDDEKVGISD